jgi:hypothetical protein
MNAALLKSAVALLPISVLLVGSAVLFSRDKSLCSFLQLFGALCLMVVVLTHVCEAVGLFSSMRWGREHSVGHYLDFWSAAVGLTLFPLGFLFHALGGRNAQ